MNSTKHKAAIFILIFTHFSLYCIWLPCLTFPKHNKKIISMAPLTYYILFVFQKYNVHASFSRTFYDIPMNFYSWNVHGDQIISDEETIHLRENINLYYLIKFFYSTITFTLYILYDFVLYILINCFFQKIVNANIYCKNPKVVKVYTIKFLFHPLF